jgi:hypothetical protein
MVRESDMESSTRENWIGDGVSRLRIGPGGRRVGIPQLVVAVLLVVVSALAAVVVFSQVSARDPVVALANPVERGQILSVEDLRAVYVASDDPVETVPATGWTRWSARRR